MDRGNFKHGNSNGLVNCRDVARNRLGHGVKRWYGAGCAVSRSARARNSERERSRLASGAVIVLMGFCAACSGPLQPPVPTPSSASAPPPPVSGQRLPSLAPMLSRVVPAVVNIATTTRVRIQLSPLLSDPFFRQFFRLPKVPLERRRQSLGSGVIVDADRGYALTNCHVIAGADQVSVTLADGRRFDARVVGADAATDIAVIQVPADRLTAVPLGDSDALEVGDFVVAIGNPFGLGQTVTLGIVSALGRRGPDDAVQNFIQTDASINPGSSGGALVNLRGELVGINTAIVGVTGVNVGISFAVPSEIARNILSTARRVSGRSDRY